MNCKNSMPYKYIFGPVPSRRLGTSLGIDVMPHKTCTLDCVYCECGKTTNLNIKRSEYMPAFEIKKELSRYLKDKPKLDYITFSGAGEPLLNNTIGEIIDFIKDDYPEYKIAILTNATLFYDKDVINSVLRADLVKISIDAATNAVFKKINRPHLSLNLQDIFNGLISLKKVFKGELIVEVFIVPGINDDKEELEKIKKIITELNPSKIQINTLDRPPAENWVKPLSKDEIKNIAEYLNKAETLGAPLKENPFIKKIENSQEIVIATIKRRPCTIEDISEFTGMNKKEIEKILQSLEKTNKIEKIKLERGVFFKYCIHNS
jgi:wyosine [tRNA(Phe)-imidazoG37] synthetase (radical SAM superfamily)